MRWGRFLWFAVPRITLVLLLFVAIPLAILFTFSFSLESILAVVIIFQLYVIVIQTDLGQRQQRLYSLDYKPSFVVEVPRERTLRIKNTSSKVAYNVFLRLDGEKPGAENTYHYPAIQGKRSADIRLNSLVNLNNVDGLEIWYRDNIGGDWSDYFFRMGETDFCLVAPLKKRSGTLLNLFEDLLFIWKSLWLPRRIRKLRELQRRKRKMPN